MRAVALLSMWKTRNALRTLFTDPRKLVPFILALVWLGFVGMLVTFGGGGGAPSGSRGRSVSFDVFQAVVFFAFILLSITVIDTGLGDNLLAFPPADVDYIFPSPISRRVVLLYRIPALTFSSCFFAGTLLFAFRFLVRLAGPAIDHPANVSSSRWLVVAAAVMCVGTYTNLAMFIAIRFAPRRTIHRVLMAGLFLLVAAIALVGYLRGVPAAAAAVESAWFRWPFLPAYLASQVIVLRYAHESVSPPVLDLVGIYALSFIPMFATNSNFYEDSIASSERTWALRRAARGGFASLMAAQAAGRKFRATREYTVRPFGQGAGALMWAHLCAAWKRPFVNFLLPVITGAAIGLLAAAVNAKAGYGAGFAIIGVLVFYSSMGFMGAAKTASEAAVRRRELTATLPISGWQSVAANLAVPLIALTLFAGCAALGYAVLGGDLWLLVACALGILFPLRMLARMLIQYMLVLAYPDFADKIQQFLGQMIYYVFGAPLLIIELVLCVPAFLLHSLWLGLVILTVFEAVASTLFLFLAGRVSERAIATGEPVRFWKMARAAG